ncbi:MAG: hypothetical protein IJ512_01080 [Ruminococcus sp.]|nr:hypothetical protein [Ruminococcus sp.]
MKKRIALAAAALLMVCSLTGCFGNDDTVSSEAGSSETSESHTETEKVTVTERTSEDRADEMTNDHNGVVGDVVTEAGDAVSDVVDGAENIVDDITGSDTTTTETTESTT